MVYNRRTGGTSKVACCSGMCGQDVAVAKVNHQVLIKVNHQCLWFTPVERNRIGYSPIFVGVSIRFNSYSCSIRSVFLN